MVSALRPLWQVLSALYGECSPSFMVSDFMSVVPSEFGNKQCCSGTALHEEVLVL